MDEAGGCVVGRVGGAPLYGSREFAPLVSGCVAMMARARVTWLAVVVLACLEPRVCLLYSLGVDAASLGLFLLDPLCSDVCLLG